MKIRKPTMETARWAGATYAVVVLSAVTLTPKTSPEWVKDIVLVAMVVLFMAAAAVGAVLWERYGPNGCKLAEFEGRRAQFEQAKADFDIAVADFKAVLKSEGGAR